MVYARITEGLGNQLFKYACAFAVAENNKDKIIIDTSGYEFRSRGYMLDKLNISAEVGAFPIPKSDGKFDRAVAKIKRYILINKTGICKIVNEHKETQMNYGNYDFRYQKNIYMDGYWQNHQYFDNYKNKLMHEFSPKYGILSYDCITIMDKMKSENSVAIHIRRGDYSTNWLIDIKFYFDAIKIIETTKSRLVYYLFCEDKKFATEFASKHDGIIIISNIYKFSDIEEFFLMSSCKNQIIANSTFSWWAAYLNQNTNQIVIAPDFKQWTGDYYPEKWITIKARPWEENNGDQ